LRGAVDKYLGLLANEVNLQILLVLSKNPTYTRELSLILDRDETDISRRLKRLEEAGLVKGKWIRIRDRNVKVYFLARGDFEIRLRGGRIELDIGSDTIFTILDFRGHGWISTEPIFGRDRELEILSMHGWRVAHIWGPPGSGKTHLTSIHILNNWRNRPVYWIHSTNDPIDIILWRIGLYLSNLGYNKLLNKHLTINDAVKSIKEGLEETRLILVVDNFHQLGSEASRLFKELAIVIEEPSLYIISNRREDLPYWAGGILSLELGPISRGDFKKLIEYYYGVVDDNLLDIVYENTSGLPGLGWRAINLSKMKQLSLIEASRIINDMYLKKWMYNGLTQEQRLILEILASIGGEVSVETLCKIDNSICNQDYMSELEKYGLIELVGGYIYPKQISINMINSMVGDKINRVRVQVANILLESGDYRERMKGLNIMAENCITDPINRVVRNRLLNVDDWPLCCINNYINVLEKASKCSSVGRIIGAELLVMGELNLKGNLRGFLSKVDEYIMEYEARDVLVTAKLKALKCAVSCLLGDMSGVNYCIEALESVRDIGGIEAKKVKGVVLTNLSNALLQYKGDYTMALKMLEDRLNIALEDEDLRNYLTALASMAELYKNMGDFKTAGSLAEEAYRGAKVLGLEPVKVQAIIPLADSLLIEGELDKVIKLSEEALESEGNIIYSRLALIPGYVALVLKGDMGRAEILSKEIDKVCSIHGISGSCIIYDVVNKIIKGGGRDMDVSTLSDNLSEGEKRILSHIIRMLG